IASAALDDPQPIVRRAAAAALATIEDERSPAVLVKALGDDDASVRAAVAESIGRIGLPALDLTVEALSEHELEDGALIALDRLPVESCQDAIRAYARDRTTRALHYHSMWQWTENLVETQERARLLVDSLRWMARYHGTNVLRAVAALEDGNAVHIAIDSLGSNDPLQLANAVETLD
ncbi:MAG: hypothetical protein GWO02_18065, partial [Gammaproteobacteria bacterium]|nr:hypothetical protein [Gammaproteobacteria bacterium]